MKSNRVRVLERVLTLGIAIGLVGAAPAQEPGAVCFLTVGKSQQSGNPERKNYVINDTAAWEDLWDKVNAGLSPKPALPEIDFTRRTIIAIFQGSQPTSGYEVTITNIVNAEGHIQVVVKELMNPNCGGLGVITRPFHIVEVDKLDAAAIEFRVKQKVRKCS